MRHRQSFERGVLALGFCALGLVAGLRPAAALPEATAVTPALVEAAKKEGKVVFYTAVDVEVAEKVGASFRQKYPGIEIQVERSGSERLFQRIGQEYGSNIANADVVNTSDAAHYLLWKRQGWLAPYVPEDAVRHFPPDGVDGDGMYATLCVSLCCVGYNTNLIKREDAPSSFADLLDPKWRGKIVKGHPAYSGTILTATFALARALGWSYFEKLARQKVMQVQSASDPPKKLGLGERAVQADGADAILLQLKEQGQPVEVVHAVEGTPLITTPGGVFRSALNPNAARLFQSFLCSADGQRVFVEGNRHPFHTQVKGKPGLSPLSTIKLMKSDPAEVDAQSEEIKARYTKLFGV